LLAAIILLFNDCNDGYVGYVGYALAILVTLVMFGYVLVTLLENLVTLWLFWLRCVKMAHIKSLMKSIAIFFTRKISPYLLIIITRYKHQFLNEHMFIINKFQTYNLLNTLINNWHKTCFFYLI
jgi:hypothetical protein